MLSRPSPETKKFFCLVEKMRYHTGPLHFFSKGVLNSSEGRLFSFPPESSPGQHAKNRLEATRERRSSVVVNASARRVPSDDERARMHPLLGYTAPPRVRASASSRLRSLIRER